MRPTDGSPKEMTNLLWTFVLTHPVWTGLLLLLIATSPLLVGVVRIGERQVGIVVKTFARRSLPTGRLIALDGEAGFQAETLAPGLHFGYYPWQFHVRKAPLR